MAQIRKPNSALWPPSRSMAGRIKHLGTNAQRVSLKVQVGKLPEEVKQKVLSLGKDDLPIAERRRLYNQMNRRLKHPEGLPEGLAEKFNSLSAQSPKRFELLKEFICDRDMQLGTLHVTPLSQPRQSCEVEAFFVQPGPQGNSYFFWRCS